jgi:hypothetical protein
MLSRPGLGLVTSCISQVFREYCLWEGVVLPILSVKICVIPSLRSGQVLDSRVAEPGSISSASLNAGTCVNNPSCYLSDRQFQPDLSSESGSELGSRSWELGVGNWEVNRNDYEVCNRF